ncbi:MAG: hypothetical protein E7Z84_08845 [Methanosphaera stadtmanae]|nr:hypothetical protein [Methanosphaera stadtmanae]
MALGIKIYLVSQQETLSNLIKNKSRRRTWNKTKKINKRIIFQTITLDHCTSNKTKAIIIFFITATQEYHEKQL